jgi:hypothetical protein
LKIYAIVNWVYDQGKEYLYFCKTKEKAIDIINKHYKIDFVYGRVDIEEINVIE